MMVIFRVERSEGSLCISFIRKLATVVTGNCWRSNMIYLGSTLFIILVSLMNVANSGSSSSLVRKKILGLLRY
jgi:hypothetical protein